MQATGTHINLENMEWLRNHLEGYVKDKKMDVYSSIEEKFPNNIPLKRFCVGGLLCVATSISDLATVQKICQKEQNIPDLVSDCERQGKSSLLSASITRVPLTAEASKITLLLLENGARLLPENNQNPLGVFFGMDENYSVVKHLCEWQFFTTASIEEQRQAQLLYDTLFQQGILTLPTCILIPESEREMMKNVHDRYLMRLASNLKAHELENPLPLSSKED